MAKIKIENKQFNRKGISNPIRIFHMHAHFAYYLCNCKDTSSHCEHVRREIRNNDNKPYAIIIEMANE